MSINDAKNQIKLFTVDGPIPVTGGGSPSTEYTEGSAHTSASGPATMCVVDTSTPSLTDETYTTLRTDAAGNVKTVAIVSGTVAVENFPVTQPVSGTVSVGNFPATQPVSGTVAVINFPTAAALSDTTVNPTTAMTGAALMVYDSVSARWVRAISGHGPVTTGVQRIAPAEAVTYIASTGLFTPANTTDSVFFEIFGSATKTVRIHRIVLVSGTSSGGGAASQAVLCTAGKRSSASSGGAPVTATMVPNDSLNPAATASVTYYTSPPSGGFLTGTIASFYLPLTAVGIASEAGLAATETAYSYGGAAGTQPIVLRGTSQGVTIANRVAMVGTNTISAWVEFSEE
jgi:hypothetical protein